GVKPGTGPVDMDILDYKYTNGNQLDAVSDQGIADYGAGDFQNGHSGSGDYAYDGNGNLSKDLNKGIGGVTYNHFNKPVAIDLGGGKKIEYSYDAAGNKVQELVIYPGQPTKRTDYIGNFIYRNDTLQYALTAGGRTVFDYSSTTPVKEEYFVKDHLGNVRSTIDIITYEIRQYLATYEVASANLEGMLFEKVGEIRDEKPASTDPGDSKAGRLNGAEAGREVGTSLLVKVMAGDRVDMNVNNYYETFEGNTTEPVTAEQMMGSIISTLTNGVGGLPGESHNTKLVNEIFTQENFSALENLIQDQGIDPGRPQAYLTYALFDENMKLVSEFAGAYQANGNGAWGSIGSNGAKVIPANGYLAVYLSSRWRDLQCIPCSNMFFDKLNVEVSKGNLLEENHYYPHGLPIQPLSSVSTNFRENRRKYQSNEYIKDLGLNWMDFQARQYDPQIGRFLAVDPLADAGGQQVWSPYAAMGNAPESQVDPNGAQPSYFNVTNFLPQIPGYIIRSGVNNANAPGGMAGWMMEVNLEMTNSYFINRMFGIESGITRESLEKNGFVVDQEDAYSISYHKNTQTDPNDITSLTQTSDIIAKSSGTDWISIGSTGISSTGTLGSAVESVAGTIRLNKSNWFKSYGAQSYELLDRGRRWTKQNTFSLARRAKVLGLVTFIGGSLLDGYGVVNYYRYGGEDQDHFIVTPHKGVVNLVVGGIGLFTGIPGAIGGAFYFGIDTFYPGGWSAAMDNNYNVLMQNRQVVQGFKLFPKEY
ncbi:RHS repeat-associated core domain-containing protein, partial [Taibaiella helva]|uniref:RHS repeat-associated core domain-containing protein n=1 Tax=Taibaiella helva TaxID=2301235 RepID=UPI0029373C85